MKSTTGSRKSHRSKKTAASEEESDRHYSVGYGKPPLPSRFARGRSGNARGRPKGTKNLKTLIRQAMTASISIKEGTNSRRLSKIEGVVLRQLQNALKADDRSAMAVIKMATQLGILEELESNTAETFELSATDKQILEQLLTRRNRIRRR